jgi:hypothetical protein
MPIKDNKLETDAKLTEHHKKSLIAHRDHLIMTQFKNGFTKAEIAFVFNLRIKNISKIIKKYE